MAVPDLRLETVARAAGTGLELYAACLDRIEPAFRCEHDTVRTRLDRLYVQRYTPRDTEPAPLTDRHGEDAVVQSDRPPVLEVHVLDVDLSDDLYGAEVEVSFVRRLRDELVFPNIEGLVAQIRADIEASRPYLSHDNLVEVIRPADP